MRVLGLRGVKATGAAVVDHALGVAHEHVLALHAQAHHDVHAGNGCCAGAGNGHLHVFNLLAYQFQTVEQGGARDDGRTVLVVVEDGDVHALGEFLLNVEALGRLDVFEVDAAQRGLQRGDDLDQLVRIALVQLDVEHVHACKLLEETPLAFHHRLASQRADVTQTQHSRAVGDHAHQIATRGVLGGLAGVCLNVQAGVGHAGGVGQRQIALVGQWLGGGHRNLALVGACVVLACSIAQCLLSGGQSLCHNNSRGLIEIQLIPLLGLIA